MGNVNQCVFQPLTALYGSPRTEDEETFFDLWEEGLEKFADENLEAGVKHIIKNRESPFWPTLAEVINACRTTSTREVHYSAFSDASQEKFTPASAEEKAKVQAMVEDLNKKIAEQVENKRVTAPKGTYFDRPAFETLQGGSPNRHFMMTERGQEKFRETGRKPEHPSPNLTETDTFKEMSRAYDQKLNRGQG